MITVCVLEKKNRNVFIYDVAIPYETNYCIQCVSCNHLSLQQLSLPLGKQLTKTAILQGVQHIIADVISKDSEILTFIKQE